jgi:hypothetical protein
VGLFLSGVVYWLLTRNLDRAAEAAAITISESELVKLETADTPSSPS